MKAYGGVDVQIHVFLTSALVGGEWSASALTVLPRKGGWVGPRTGLDDVEKIKFLTIPGLELRPLQRPTRSQSLYRLLYPQVIREKKSASYSGKYETFIFNIFTFKQIAFGNKFLKSCIKHHYIINRFCYINYKFIVAVNPRIT
jgi:hypothetical protein